MYYNIEQIEFELQYSLQEKKSASEVMFFSKNTNRPDEESDFIHILWEKC